MQKELIQKESFKGVKFKLVNSEGRNRECADKLREEFEIELINGVMFFLVDISEVLSINSSFIGVIGYMEQQVNKTGKIIIYGANEEIIKSLKIAKLDEMASVEISQNPEFTSD